MAPTPPEGHPPAAPAGRGRPRTALGTFSLTRQATISVVIVAVGAALGRLAQASHAALAGDLDPLNAFGFSVILPLTLLFMVKGQGPSRTREGALMRFGTMIQLVLIISLEPFALHLLLGFPVVFLCVELFETCMPAGPRERLARMVVS